MRGSLVDLRPMEIADSEILYLWYSDPDVMDITGIALPVCRSSIIEMASCDPSSKKAVRLMICPKGEEIPIGTAFLFNIDWINRSAEYGIIIGSKEHWSGGHGEDATKAVIDYAFLSLGLNRLYLSSSSINKMAIMCYKNSGFIEEGLLREGRYCNGKRRDVVLMSILRRDHLGKGEGASDD